MYNTINGDLIEMSYNGEFDAIVHGANCRHRMGSGIARQIAEVYPDATQADIELTDFGDYLKLGTFSMAGCPRKKGLPLKV